MALVLKDRVLETCTSPGTGTVTLLGAVTGYQSFSTIGDGNTCYYTIADQSGASWEVGIGTYSSAGTLARTTVLSSSSAGALTNFSSGVQNVFLTYPSSRAVNLSSGALTSGRVVYTTTGGSLTDSANLLYSGTDLNVYGITVGRGGGNVSGNLALGVSALAGVNTGGANIGIGSSALGSNTSGVGNIGIGLNTLYPNLSGNYNISLGYSASRNNTSGSSNIAIGYEALYNSTTFNNNIAIGYQALYTANTADVTTSQNMAIGHEAGKLITTGKKLVIIGPFSGNGTSGDGYSVDMRQDVGGTVISDGFGYPFLYSNSSSSNGTTIYGKLRVTGGIFGGTFFQPPLNIPIKNTPISLYYTTTTNAQPDPVELIAGELALNTTDGKLFYKDTAGVVQVLANKGTSGGTFTSISATSITDSGLTSGRVTFAGASGLLSDSANLTWNGTALTVSASSAISGVFNRNTSSGATVQIQVVGGSVGTLGSDTGGNGIFDIAATSSMYLRSTGASSIMAFSTNNTEQMRISSAGVVDIGVTGLAANANGAVGKLVLRKPNEASGNGQITRMLDFASYYPGFDEAVVKASISSGVDTGTQNGQLGFMTATGGVLSEKMRILANGNVGIGTSSSPANKLTVADNSASAMIYGTQSGAGDLFALANSASEKFRITNAGNVGIGTDSPAFKTEIVGGATTVETTLLQIRSNAGGIGTGSTIAFANSTNASAGSGRVELAGIRDTASGSSFVIRTADSGGTIQNRVKVNESGFVGIGTSSSPAFKLEVVSAASTPAAAAFRTSGFADDNVSTVYLQDDTANALGVGGRIAFRGLNDVGSYTSFATIQGAKENATTGNNAGAMIFKTNPNAGTLTEQMRISSAGNVGINAISPVAKLHVKGSGTSGQVSASFILENSSSGTGGMDITGTPGASRWRFLYGGGPSTGTNALTQAMCILTEGASAGNVGIGTNSPNSKLTVTGGQTRILNSTAFVANPLDNGSWSGAITVNTNDGSGDLSGLGMYVNSSYGAGCGIFAKQTSSTTADLTFFTGTGVGASNTEKMRINSSGDLVVGGTTPDVFGNGFERNFAVVVTGGGSTSSINVSGGVASRIQFGTGSTRYGLIYQDASNFMQIGTTTALPISFITNSTEQMRITSAGKTIIGSNTTVGAGGDAQLTVNGNSLVVTPNTAGKDTHVLTTGAANYGTYAIKGDTVTKVYLNTNGDSYLTGGNFLVGVTNTAHTSAGFTVEAGGVPYTTRGSGGTLMGFYNLSAAIIGSITNSSDVAVLYNTTSDQRLKTNIVDAPSGNIDDIKVRSFDWIADGSHQEYGVVAQELLEVAPYAVYQPENSDEMMAVDYSKLVPMMIKEIQDLKQRIATLENK